LNVRRSHKVHAIGGFIERQNPIWRDRSADIDKGAQIACGAAGGQKPVGFLDAMVEFGTSPRRKNRLHQDPAMTLRQVFYRSHNTIRHARDRLPQLQVVQSDHHGYGPRPCMIDRGEPLQQTNCGIGADALVGNFKTGKNRVPIGHFGNAVAHHHYIDMVVGEA
jgi:hypothetical protein